MTGGVNGILHSATEFMHRCEITPSPVKEITAWFHSKEITVRPGALMGRFPALRRWCQSYRLVCWFRRTQKRPNVYARKVTGNCRSLKEYNNSLSYKYLLHNHLNCAIRFILCRMTNSRASSDVLYHYRSGSDCCNQHGRQKVLT